VKSTATACWKARARSSPPGSPVVDISMWSLARDHGDQSEARRVLSVLRERRAAGLRVLNATQGVTCLNADTTFYLYPNITDAMKRGGFADSDTFRHAISEEPVFPCARVRISAIHMRVRISPTCVSPTRGSRAMRSRKG
jgi:hypothetical protein